MVLWESGLMAIASSKLGRLVRQEGESDDRLILRLRDMGLVKPAVSNADLVRVFEQARAEHRALSDAERSFNSPHERVRVFLAPYLTARGQKWAVPLESLHIPDE
jgi:hypothetical protein